MEITTPTLLDADTFLEFVRNIQDDVYRFELIEGVLIEMTPPSMKHGHIAGRIYGKIFIYLEANPIGLAFGDNVGYRLHSKTIFVPDVSFVAQSNLIIPLPEISPIAPDLAVEILSPSNTFKEISFKIESYLHYGTKIVWIVHPDDEMVDVWRMMPDGSLNKRAFKKGDSLSGEDVLPNFTLPIGDIFNL
jgi:Uma2 family endonuclease